MKLYGSLTELGTVQFRQNTQNVVLEPNQGTTYTATRTIQLPPGDASDILVSAASTQTLTNKTISGASNTLSNISLTSAVTGILPPGNGGTGQNSSATFPTSGVIVTEAGTETLTNKTLTGNTAVNLISGSGTLVLNTTGTITLPNATDTLVGKATTDTLTNKSISGSSNSLTNISLTASVTGILPLANGGTNSSSASGAFINLSPLSTAGDLLYENATPVPARLPIGSTGQVLTVVGGLPAWATSGAGGTFLDGTFKIENTADNTKIIALDASLIATGTTRTLTSPNASGILSLVSLTSSSPGTNQTIGITSGTSFVYTPSVSISVTLNNTFNGGQKIQIVNSSTTNFIFILANDASVIRTLFPSTTVELICISGSPSTNTSWECIGAAASDWISYTPSFNANFGTNSGVDFRYRRAGGDIEIKGYFTTGTLINSGAPTITLPVINSSQLNVDTARLPAGANMVILGIFVWGASSQLRLFQSSESGVISWANVSPVDSTMMVLEGFVASNKTSLLYTTPFGQSFDASGDMVTIDYKAPIVGWTTTKG